MSVSDGHTQTGDGSTSDHHPTSRNAALALAALGVVFGDIGTSPLYAFQQCFGEGGGFAALPEHIFGILSLIVWALIGVVCFKYAFYILRADHDGEGGTLALYALLRPKSHGGIPPRLTTIALLVLFGSAMLYGDGVITPAISVLSALEGLDVATTAAHAYILPLTIAILFALFYLQSRGTGKIGAIFGPVMVLWFVALGIGGFVGILHHPDILYAANPIHAIRFLLRNHWPGFLVLGAVVLCVSGVEALYADLGHFGRTPIRLAWGAVVFPALLLNYFGQGALTLENPKNMANTFYALYPGHFLLPMVALATIATVIASQALISGAFSLTQQAMQLGYLPRLRVIHTSYQHQGQIFVPLVNVLLATACIALVLAFQTSARLGSAYGLAVTVTMTASSVTFFYVVIRRWKWSKWHACAVVATFMVFDLSFLISNMLKIVSGAWVPLLIASLIMVLFTTWVEGRRRQATALAELSVPAEEFERDVAALPPGDRLQETAVFFTPQTVGIPFVLRHRWLRSHVLHEEIVLLTIVHARRPYIPLEERVSIDVMTPKLKRILAHYGFMEQPLIDEILDCADRLHGIVLNDPTYFLVDPKIRRSHGARAFPSWRRWLLTFMMRNARPLTEYLNLPVDRVVQFGVEVRV
jgi:KUP system potassium uptake protein